LQLIAQASSTSRAEGLVVLDACIESILRTALDSRSRTLQSPATGTEHGVLGLLTAVDRALRPNSPLANGLVSEAELLRLREVRNTIQHSGITPSQATTQEQVAAFNANITPLVRSVFNIEWEHVSIAILINDEMVKNLYLRGEVSQSQGRVEDAMVAFVAAFETARFNEQQELIGSLISWAEAAAEDSSVADLPGHSRILTYMNKLREEVEVMKLRLDYKEYRKFADINPNALTPNFEPFWPFGDSSVEGVTSYWSTRLASTVRRVSEARGSDVDVYTGFVNWVDFAHRFVAEAILNWQSTSRVPWSYGEEPSFPEE
jgi:hypothetical protein